RRASLIQRDLRVLVLVEFRQTILGIGEGGRGGFRPRREITFDVRAARCGGVRLSAAPRARLGWCAATVCAKVVRIDCARAGSRAARLILSPGSAARW